MRLLGAILLLFISSLSHAEDAFNYIWGGYATSLVTRSDEQRHNTVIAARELNGIIIPPGGTFSFNARVGARDSGKGYTAAPIIDHSGQLQDSPGGGICQLASTIYNAALMAGMEVIERHPHSRAVGHVPPGRDATISSWRKDLKLKNRFSTPLKLRIETSDYRLYSSFRGTSPPPFTVEIITEKQRIEPETVITGKGGRNRQRGATGFSTVTKRLTRQGDNLREEIVSTDIYPPPSRLYSEDSTEPSVDGQ